MANLRLLAIEDEPIFAESLRMVLDELGYILINVTDDIKEFQRLVKATIPDILLIDIDLGAEIDGIQLAEELAEYSDAPVIFLTASKDLETITRAKSARPSAYLPKPYEASALQAAIELATLRPGISATIVSAKEEDTFFVKSEGVLKKVKVNDLKYIEVKEKFCHLSTNTGVVIVNMRLKDLLDQLPVGKVVQIHRSFAVMKDCIDEVDVGMTGIKVGTVSLPVGKNYKESLNTFMKRIG